MTVEQNYCKQDARDLAVRVMKAFGPKETDAKTLVFKIYEETTHENPNDPKAVVLAMSGIIYDGLAYGNWPTHGA